VFQSRREACFGFFEEKLRALLSYDDLKPEVFQLFRSLSLSLSLTSSSLHYPSSITMLRWPGR
jgi:hypothetical protein